VPLGDVAGAVDAGKEDRHALQPRPLQRRKPMTDLLQRSAEPGGEKLDVVAQLARRLVEAAIGQDQRAGEIVVQADATDLDGLLGAEARLLQHLLNRVAGMELGHLDGDLKIARRRRGVTRKGQDAACGVEAADRLFARIAAHHPHPVSALEEAGKRRKVLPLPELQLAGEAFRQHVDVVDIVVDEMEEVAHLVIGGRLVRGSSPKPVVIAHQLFAVAAIGLVAGDQRMRQPRRVLGDELQFLQARRIGLEQGVTQRLRQRRQKPIVLTRRKFSNVDAELFRQRQQHRGRDRPLVVLDLVEIAGGNADLVGKLGLRGMARLADFAHLAPDEKLADRHLQFRISLFANS